jgi:creatinine amidohydrolase
MDKLRRTRNFQPVLGEIRSIAPTGWYGTPERATLQKGNNMVKVLAEAISTEAEEIFKQLDAVQKVAASRNSLG